LAEFEIAAPDLGDEKAEFTVYYFGGPTGGVKANIERWIGQFVERGREVKLKKGESDQGEYVLAEISGTWKKPDGPPFARKTINKPNSRVFALILTTEVNGKQDYYFTKLAGPDEVVKRNAAAFRTVIGADMKAEEVYDMDQDRVVKSEAEWRRILSAEQFRVLRMKGTERPFTNKYDKHFEAGTYACAACGQELFSSETKFNSGCGWPAFYAAKAGDRVKLSRDLSLGMVRVEVCCARCGSHLGHIFDDAPQTPTGQRYCINSVSLKFIPAKSERASGDEE
jgi:peptide-methionine (R)-S-oxide reductase